MCDECGTVEIELANDLFDVAMDLRLAGLAVLAWRDAGCPEALSTDLVLALSQAIDGAAKAESDGTLIKHCEEACRALH